MADEEVIAIGLLVGHDDRDDAESLAEELPHVLGERVGGHAKWRAELCETEPANSAASSGELVAAVRRRLLTRGWQMGVGLTRLPLRERRPVATHASASHGVGLISLPALVVDQRGEWQQRIQAVLYHHGIAQRRDLLTAEKRQWLTELECRRRRASRSRSRCA